MTIPDLLLLLLLLACIAYFFAKKYRKKAAKKADTGSDIQSDSLSSAFIQPVPHIARQSETLALHGISVYSFNVCEADGINDSEAETCLTEQVEVLSKLGYKPHVSCICNNVCFVFYITY
jgi:hypothetical protein